MVKVVESIHRILLEYHGVSKSLSNIYYSARKCIQWNQNARTTSKSSQSRYVVIGCYTVVVGCYPVVVGCYPVVTGCHSVAVPLLTSGCGCAVVFPSQHWDQVTESQKVQKWRSERRPWDWIGSCSQSEVELWFNQSG